MENFVLVIAINTGPYAPIACHYIKNYVSKLMLSLHIKNYEAMNINIVFNILRQNYNK